MMTCLIQTEIQSGKWSLYKLEVLPVRDDEGQLLIKQMKLEETVEIWEGCEAKPFIQIFQSARLQRNLHMIKYLGI